MRHFLEFVEIWKKIITKGNHIRALPQFPIIQDSISPTYRNGVFWNNIANFYNK